MEKDKKSPDPVDRNDSSVTAAKKKETPRAGNKTSASVSGSSKKKSSGSPKKSSAPSNSTKINDSQPMRDAIEASESSKVSALKKPAAKSETVKKPSSGTKTSKKPATTAGQSGAEKSKPSAAAKSSPSKPSSKPPVKSTGGTKTGVPKKAASAGDTTGTKTAKKPATAAGQSGAEKSKPSAAVKSSSSKPSSKPPVKSTGGAKAKPAAKPSAKTTAVTKKSSVKSDKTKPEAYDNTAKINAEKDAGKTIAVSQTPKKLKSKIKSPDIINTVSTDNQEDKEVFANVSSFPSAKSADQSIHLSGGSLSASHSKDDQDLSTSGTDNTQGIPVKEKSAVHAEKPKITPLAKRKTSPASRRKAAFGPALILRMLIFIAVLLAILATEHIINRNPRVLADDLALFSQTETELEPEPDEQNGIVEEQEISEIISLLQPRKKTYLPLEGEWKLEAVIEFTGSVDESIIWSSSDQEIASVSDSGTVTGHSNGTAVITATAVNGMSDSSEVVVTDCIILPSYERKEFIPAYYYDEQQAQMMDDILFSRVADAGGYGTRGAVVAAARFITLEMPYMIPYFYENGRMDANPGRPICDGEGRYYHVGLYLSESKYKDIKKSVAGPSFWGAPLTNFQNEGFFESGRRYPNGLDCSGFVSWVMINGGIDSGDIGAGYYMDVEKEFYKIGDRTTLTVDLLKSGTVKSGDLIGKDGHIAVVAGIDDTYIWVAESFYRGVNVRRFTIERGWSGVIDCDDYSYIINMDHMYYNGDGIYSDTWE